MELIYQIIILLSIHFVADFLLQSDWMAMNKSKSLIPLTTHVAIYTGAFLVFGIWYFPLVDVLLFCGITFVAHLLTDLYGSKLTSSLFKQKRHRAFFNVIGFDQLLHAIQLILCYKFIILN